MSNMDPEEFKARQAAYMVHMADLVLEHGLAIQGVFPAEGAEDPEPGFVYTVGLAAHDKPELIAFGLPMEVGKAILNDLGFRIIAGEIEVEAGDVIHQLVEGYEVRVVQVRDSWQHLTISNKLFGNPDGALPALQLVFPDMNGVFPWEPGCTIAWQPVLGEWIAPWGPHGARELTLTEPDDE